jgi:hypothetical protein
MGKYTAHVEDHLILPARVSLTHGQEREFRTTGIAIPAPVDIRLLIDTGSKRTTLIPGIVRHLRADVAASARLITSEGAVETDLFWVCLEFPEAGLAPFPEILVARLPMPAALSQFHGLLGRDLLRRLESFDYQGRRGCYTVRDTAGVLGWLRRWL